MSNRYIVFHDVINAMTTMENLVNEGYVVMLSKEENLWVVNYLEVMSADRNDVVFMERAVFDEKYVEARDEVEIIEDEEESDSCPNAIAGDHYCRDCFYKYYKSYDEPCLYCKRSMGDGDMWSPFRKGCGNCEYDELDSNFYPCNECNHNYTDCTEDRWEPKH